jgi:hypothetical protein
MVLLLAAQYWMFNRHALREVVWAYPDHFDQANYLGLTYQNYDRSRSEGVWAVVRGGLAAPWATGVLFPVEGSLFLLLFGPSRLGALTMHFAHFALLEITLFTTLACLTRRYSVGWLGVGLLLAAVTPFAASGGMFDYRIDFTALCLFGVTVCLVARARLMASWGWAAAAAAAGSWMVLTRSITAAYLAGIFGIIFLHACVRWWRGRHDADVCRLALRQLGGLVVAGTVVAALTGPFFWNNRAGLYQYYGVSHLLGGEAAFRNRGIGVNTLLDSVDYYPRELGVQHLGWTFLALAALLPPAALVVRFLPHRGQAAEPAAMRVDRGSLWLLALSALALPYALLSLDTVKNAAVVGIVVPGLVWLLVLGVVALSRAPRLGLTVLAGFTLAVGFSTWVYEYRQPGLFVKQRMGYRRIGELYDAIEEHCREMGWAQPRVAATCIETDYFQPVVIPAYVYERHHVVICPQPGRLAGNPAAVTEAEALDELGRADFVMLVDPKQAPSAYPYDESMRVLFPTVQAFCEANLTPLRRWQIWHFDVMLFTRKTGRVAESPGSERAPTP